MKKHFIPALFLTCCPMAFADAELDRLRTSYEGAVERAVSPLRETYKQELLKLMDRHTRAGNLDAALAIRRELQDLTGEAFEQPGEGRTAIGERPGKEVETFFVDKTWRTPTGTSFTFNKDGKGSRQFGTDITSFRWKLRGQDTVEATGASNSKGKETTWYFRFFSAEEALYGSSRETAKSPLELKK